jgi:hypothetical protein
MRRRCDLSYARMLALAGLILASLLSGEAGAQRNCRAVRLKGGETLRITAPGGPDFFLHFVAVVSDERCPARVTCAWANPPVIALAASAQGAPTRLFELSSGGPGGVRQANYLGASIKYGDLFPIPQESGEFAKLKPIEAYTAVVNIGGPEEKQQ